MASLSEQMREIQDEGLCDLCLITIVSDAEALEAGLAEVTAQRDELLKVLKHTETAIKESDYWWMSEPNKGGFDLEMISEAIAKCEGRMVELLPCPFCGSHPKSGNGFAATESTVFIWCSNENCYLSPVGRDERFFTVEEWNTRAPPHFPVWEINELTKERDALKAYIEATKTAYAHMVKLKDQLCTELEAARKQEPFCWYMWDGDQPGGLQYGFHVFGDENPASGKPDHQGHVWKAIKLYASPVPAQKWNLITN